MNKTKYNFFDQIRYAVGKPMEYFRLTKVSGGRMTGFVFLFVLITSLFTIIPLFYTLAGPSGYIKYFRENLPAFQMTNGELSVDGRHEVKDGSTYILVDTSVDEFSISDIDYSNYEAILVSKTNMIIYQLNGTQEFNFEELRGFNFNNKIINDLMPALYLVMGFGAIFIYLISVGAYFLTALIYSLIGLIVCSVIHIHLPYGTIFKIAIYGKVTASILSALLNVLPINIPGFISILLSIIITGAFVVYGTRSFISDAAKEETGFDTPPQNPYM